MKNKLLKILTDICKINPTPCKKTVQKLIYLMERKGGNLSYDYSIHFYGPYSKELNEEIYDLASKNEIDINPGKESQTLSVTHPTPNDLSTEERSLIATTLAYYGKKSPRELEIITTTDFAAEALKKKGTLNNATLIALVKQIKGKKFTDGEIEASIETLKENELLTL